MDALSAVIEKAYDVFGKYRAGNSLVVCYCNVCMAPETETLLRITPLREISSNLLAEYTNSAHGYDEGPIANDLRYFLPRYFELLARNDPPHHYDYRNALARLGEANYRMGWPKDEVEAIDQFFDALWVHQIADPSLIVDPIEEVPEIEGFLQFVANSGGDVERLLRIWDADTSMLATIRLAQFVDEVATASFSGKIDLKIVAWLRRTQIRARLESAFFAAPNEATAELLSRANALLA